MCFKFETQSLLKSFFSMVETEFDLKVRCIQVDNGSEFDSMKKIIQEHGMIHQHSCVSTPQQNGVVERKHRHILNVARALCYYNKLIVYLLNIFVANN